jgi:hypothetical protein
MKGTKAMKHFLIAFLILLPAGARGQNGGAVSVIDFVKITDGKRPQAIYFYENNWKRYRDAALSKGFIRGYQLLANTSDKVKDYDLLLITEYADREQYRLSEERFNQIIKDVAPAGPRLLDDLKPADFRTNVSGATTETVFSSRP